MKTFHRWETQMRRLPDGGCLVSYALVTIPRMNKADMTKVRREQEPCRLHAYMDQNKKLQHNELSR